MKDVIGACHQFVMATECGITGGYKNNLETAIVYPGGGPVGQDHSPFVNVDTTTIACIECTKEVGFTDSGLADAIVTPFIYEANELFTSTAKGRLFMVGLMTQIERTMECFECCFCWTYHVNPPDQE
eukprot:5982086-Ditylum_brightwellii.AAC.1